MTLFFKQSGETNKETLCVKLEDDQGIMQKIHAGCLSFTRQFVGDSLVELPFQRASFSHRAASRGPKWFRRNQLKRKVQCLQDCNK
jgi:hypothetical protein